MTDPTRCPSTSELNAVISGHRAKISQAKQIRDDEKYYDARMKLLQTSMDAITRQIKTLTDMKENADEIIAESEKRIEDLKKLTIVAENRQLINKFLKAQKKQAELEQTEEVKTFVRKK